jgi:hypothetical protein
LHDPWGAVTKRPRFPRENNHALHAPRTRRAPDDHRRQSCRGPQIETPVIATVGPLVKSPIATPQTGLQTDLTGQQQLFS